MDREEEDSQKQDPKRDFQPSAATARIVLRVDLKASRFVYSPHRGERLP